MAEIEKLELDTTILVGETTYNINAEKARQVENTLNIKENDDKGLTKTFDGSEPIDISIVPSTGGTFTGPINVESFDNLKDVAGSTVINYADISKAVTNLAGSGWYTWKVNDDGTTAFETVVKNSNADGESGVVQHLGVVVGRDDDLHSFNVSENSFAKQNFKNKYLPMYLYIGTHQGNLYYGTSDSSEYIHLAYTAGSISNPTTTFTVDDLKAKFEDIYKYFTEGDDYIVKEAEGATKAVRIYQGLSDEYRHWFDYEDFAEFRSNIAKNSTDIVNTNNFIMGILDGSLDLSVSSAEAANNAAKLGNQYPSYYQKKITISSSVPSASTGTNGDIWIKY